MPAELTERPMTAGNDDTYTPEFATRDTGAHLPAVELRPMFMLKFHPMRWTVIAGRLVPALGRIALIDGCDRIAKAKDGKIRFADARAKAEENGWTLIPYNKGPGGRSYLRKIRTRPDKTELDTYLTVFEEAFVGSTLTSTDDEAYARWLRSLVDSGFLPDCPPHLAEIMLTHAAADLADAQAKVRLGHAALIPRAEALAVVVEALGEHVHKRGAKAKAEDAMPDLEEE
jgi:hypothetical protein